MIKYLEKFIFKILILILFFIAIMKYIDIRNYVAYDKKDGNLKVESVKEKNNSLMNKIKNIVNN